MLYVDSARLARLLCELGVTELCALDYDLLEELDERTACCFPCIAACTRLRPSELMELRSMGVRTLLVLNEEDASMCPFAEVLGMKCLRAVLVTETGRDLVKALIAAMARSGGAVPLVRPRCSRLFGRPSTRCLQAYVEAVKRVMEMVRPVRVEEAAEAPTAYQLARKRRRVEP